MSKAAINYINSLRTSIKALSKWETTGEAFGFIESVDDDRKDYIYEFFCAMKVIEDLTTNHKIVLHPGRNGYRFPQKPQPKINWARFIGFDLAGAKEEFQVCLGIELHPTDAPDTPFGADISFQKAGTGEQPFDKDILLIMDAKYKSDIEDKFDVSILREFAQCVRDMQAPKPETDVLKFGSPAFKGNCLFTNGEPIEVHELYCRNRNVRQIGQFDCDGRTMVVVG